MSEREPKSKYTWKCPDCGMKVVLYVRASEPPTCQNPEKHKSKVVSMEQVKK